VKTPGHCSDAGGLSAGLHTHYTGIIEGAYLPRERCGGGILDASYHTSFPEPCGRSASRPHQSTSLWRTSERFSPDSVDVLLHGQCAHVLSIVPLVIDRDDREESRRRQLLAVHAVRRRVECVAHARGQVRPTTMAVTRTVVVRELLELIAALDRRLPQVQRAGEEAIARDAAALRSRALKRIEELERDS
jgi:hypothetical protein